ncbi:MAG: hypothetical protein FJ037_05390 [Chloroflexi bacterium]|nr:hypothetical protein [Chloroflexota bacterium]
MLGEIGRWLMVPVLVLTFGQAARGGDTASAATHAAPVAVYQTLDPLDSRRLIGFVAELDADAGDAVLGRWDLADARWVRCERKAPARYRCDTPPVHRAPRLTALVQPLPGR